MFVVLPSKYDNKKTTGNKKLLSSKHPLALLTSLYKICFPVCLPPTPKRHSLRSPVSDILLLNPLFSHLTCLSKAFDDSLLVELLGRF